MNIEQIIREVASSHSYRLSDECVNDMVERIEDHIDDLSESDR